MKREELISDAYLEEQRILHAAPRGYGGRGSKWAPFVAELAGKHGIRSVLDYGCGQGSLLRELAGLTSAELREYDPAIAGKDEPPSEPAELVVCTDVLEHIESERISFVMRHLSALSSRLLFSVISLVPTNKTLSDGRQAHILIRSIEWWKYQFDEHGFKLSKTVRGRDPKKDNKQFAAVWKKCDR